MPQAGQHGSHCHLPAPNGWAKLIGTSHLDRMRRDLMHILSDPGNGQLPPVRPTW
jgi:hypothetical protein